jgi:hypothetical protein
MNRKEIRMLKNREGQRVPQVTFRIRQDHGKYIGGSEELDRRLTRAA